MTKGTKTLLFGTHQFLLHPLFVAKAWKRLYGKPKGWRLWLAFFVHDIGYWGEPNLDDEAGELHPLVGAGFMHGLTENEMWNYFVRYHSRFLAQRELHPLSQLCPADKLAIVMMPKWLYLCLGTLSGEIDEYMNEYAAGKYAEEGAKPSKTRREWYDQMRHRVLKWVARNRENYYPYIET